MGLFEGEGERVHISALAQPGRSYLYDVRSCDASRGVS